MRRRVVKGPPWTRAGVLLSTVLVLALVGLPRASAQERVPLVRDLAVEGNRRVQAPVVLNRIKTKIGDSFTPGGIREDVRAIFGLGFFDDVQVRVEDFEGGVRVVFVVVERPILREVGYEGNHAIKTDDLREKANLRIGVLYNPVDVQRAQEAIREKYEDEGYFGVVITPRTERTPEGDLRVVFRIEEGRKLYIDRIVIEGNEALKAGQIKDVMATKERFLWILPFSTVQRKVFEEDSDRILGLYGDHGYVQARIESSEIVPDLAAGKVTLKIRVIEGPQFRNGTVTFKGNEILSAEEVGKLIRIKPGEPFSRSQVRNNVRALVDRYSELGRARAEVNPETETDPDARLVNVTFVITEGPEVYVERINITGNVKSSEKVLRRELRLTEGELFSFQKLVRSRQRLFNLGYFDEVNVTTEPGSAPDKIIVRIDVKERATGLFSIGAGYGSVDGLFGTLDITQRNLFGRGQELFLRIRFGTKSQLGLIGFTEPYLFDMPLRAGADIYDTNREFDDYTEDRLGGDIRASYPLGEFLTLSGVYRLETVDISNVPADDPTLQAQAGKTLNSEIEMTLTWDSRDNVFEPTRGRRYLLDLSFAGLGGDVQYWKVVAETAWFFPLPVLDMVFATRALAGYVTGWGGQEVPIYERFFLGGPNSLRGQETRSVAPKDAAGNVIGGTSELLFTAELLVPVFARFRLAFFFDMGNAYGFGTAFDPLDLRYTLGAGVRFFSPFGPIRLDYGYNVDKQPGEKTGYIQFTAGAPF